MDTKVKEQEQVKVNTEKQKALQLTMVKLEKTGLGIEPRFLGAILGSKLKHNIKKSAPFSWDILN